MSKVKNFQAVVSVSSSNWNTLADAMTDLRKGIGKKIKKLKEEGDVTIVNMSHSSSHSPGEGYFASAVIIVDVHDPFAELMAEDEVKTDETSVSSD